MSHNVHLSTLTFFLRFFNGMIETQKWYWQRLPIHQPVSTKCRNVQATWSYLKYRWSQIFKGGPRNHTRYLWII